MEEKQSAVTARDVETTASSTLYGGHADGDADVTSQRDLERFTTHDASINMSSSEFGDSHARPIMLRGTGLGAFVGAIVQLVTYFANDVVRAVQRSSKPATTTTAASATAAENAMGPFLTKVYGWPPPKLDPSRETAWLDGLRGVAAFLVMTYHYHVAWYGIGLEEPYGANPDRMWEIWRLPFIRLLICGGHAQVSVFFVLSGFVLSWSPLASIRAARYDKLAQSLASATFRRWLRLYLPCFIIGLISLVEFRAGLVSTSAGMKDTFFEQLIDYFWACESFANPFFLERSELQAIHSYSWTMWTIPYEFAGSMAVFLLLLGVGRIRDYRRRTAIIGGAAFYACAKANWNYWLFITGVVVGDYVKQAGGFERLSKRTGQMERAAWVVLLVIGLWLAGLPENNIFYTRTGYLFLDAWTPQNFMPIEGGARFWWCWAGIIIILCSCHLASIQKLFSHAVPRYLGRISYMLYLTHRPVYEIVGLHWRKWLFSILGTEVWNEEYKINIPTGSFPVKVVTYILTWAVALPLAIVVAHWAEILVDGPCTRFARWVDDIFVKDSDVPSTGDSTLRSSASAGALAGVNSPAGRTRGGEQEMALLPS